MSGARKQAPSKGRDPVSTVLRRTMCVRGLAANDPMRAK